MLYEKANVEVITFDNSELFAFNSSEIAEIIASCTVWGSQCGSFTITNVETGLFTCGVFNHKNCDIYDKSNSNPGHRIYYVEG